MTTAEPVIQGQIVGELSCQKNSYLRTLDAHVISCIPYAQPKTENGTVKTKATKADALANKTKSPTPAPSWLVEFDDSVLFPEGGGQPTDHGTITPLSGESQQPIKVENVERQGLKCVVHCPRPLEPGTAVRQEIDFERRWDLMQQHSGQHLLTAVMNTFDNLKTLGWGMGAGGEMSYVDIPRKPTDEETQQIQKKVNDVIQQNLAMTIEEPDPENVNTERLPDDYDQNRGVVRVVKIGDLDSNACCGTHLQQTSHAVVLILGRNESVSKGRHRQYFIAGNRAIDFATISTRAIRSMSKRLSSGTSSEDVLNKVNKLAGTVATLKTTETKLLHEIAQYEIGRVKTDLSASKKAFAHRPEPGNEFIKVVASGVKDDIQAGGSVVLASGEGKAGGAIMVTGTKDMVEIMVSKIKEAFPSVKGGGQPERWQGKMQEWKNGDLEKLQKLALE